MAVTRDPRLEDTIYRGVDERAMRKRAKSHTPSDSATQQHIKIQRPNEG